MICLIRGIDISQYQPTVDWAKVKASGIQFAYIRSSYGKNGVDPYLASHVQGARAAGVKIGFYHFAYSNLNPQPSDESKHFLEVIKPYFRQGDLLPALDYEGQSTSITWARFFVEQIKSAIGQYPVFYASSSYLATIPADNPLGRCPLWVANYSSNDGTDHPVSTPPAWRSIAIHQYTSVGSVPGIAGNVDMNHANTLPIFLPGKDSPGYALEVIEGGKIQKHLVYGNNRVSNYLKSSGFAALIRKGAVKLLRHKRGS